MSSVTSKVAVTLLKKEGTGSHLGHNFCWISSPFLPLLRPDENGVSRSQRRKLTRVVMAVIEVLLLLLCGQVSVVYGRSVNKTRQEGLTESR